MFTELWMQLMLAAGSGLLLCLLGFNVRQSRQTPLQNRALLDFLQQQTSAFWLTDSDAVQLWHNNATRFPSSKTDLARQLFFSKTGIDPGLPDILALLDISPHWQGQVWLGQSERQAYQLNVSVVSGYRQRYMLWHWHPARASIESAEHQIHDLSDPITGLPGLTLWQFWLQTELQRYQLKYHGFAILLLEVKDYPAILRNFGPAAADSLMRQLSENVQSEVPAGAFIARISAERLGLLLNLEKQGAQAEQQLLLFSRELLNFCQGPFAIPQAELRLDCHAGLAVFPDAGHNADELQAHAAHALCIAATLPERLHLWQMQGRSLAAGLNLQAELQAALTQYQCEIWSQPVIDLGSGVACAFRLELYWRSPLRGLLSYSELKPLAEQTGQLLALERWAFCQICQLVEFWLRSGPLPPVQVELSAVNFQHSGLLNFLQSQLVDYQLPASQFVLSLREDGWLEDPASFSAQAQALQAAGFQLMIVGVGAGPCALQLLQQPFWRAAELSADLLEPLEESESSRNTCASLIRLLLHQNLHVSAHGVVSDMQAYLLHVMGAQSCRGPHFSVMRPVDGQQLPYGGQQQWLKAG